jgi:hypothetical protein
MMTVFQAARQLVSRTLAIAFLVIITGVQAPQAEAGAREQAKRIHDRIAGVPPSAAVLAEMEQLLQGGNAVAAAELALQDPAFYDITLKNFVAPWTNEAMSPFVPLNDYTATVIGIVRDTGSANIDFRDVLQGDILYKGASNLNIAAHSNSNNAHYEELEASGLSLSDDNVLERTTQSAMNGELPPDATAGVITTRAAARAFFSAGTNRAMFRFTLINHMCNDLEQVADVSLPPDRIRQDVSRSPGGDSRVFLNNCVGCHTGMDPMTQAFAYYNYEYDPDNDPDGAQGRLIYNASGEINPETGTRVVAKYHINSTTFEPGFVTPDDRWDNYWRSGANRRLGWDSGLPGSGTGAKSLGREFANSDAFAQCQVTKVFRNVCLRSPSDGNDIAAVNNIVSIFKQGYNLKDVFAESAAYCKGA